MKASHGEVRIAERPADAGERLDGDVGDTEEDAGGGAEHDPVVVVRGAHARAGDQQRADHEHAALEGEHAGERVARVGAGLRGERHHEQDQADGGHGHADPLAAADLEAEEAVGQRGEDDDAGRQHGLDDRERREGERGDVQQPGAERDAHADGEPLGREEGLDGLQRMADVHVRSGVRAPVLVEKAKLRGDGAGQCQQDSDVQRHVCLKPIGRARPPRPGNTQVIGPQAPRLESRRSGPP